MNISLVCRTFILSLLMLFGMNEKSSGFERFDIVTTLQLGQMLAARGENNNDFLLVNTLDEIIFQNKTIPGSINIPWGKVQDLAHKLGDDKGKLIITHCMGYR